MLLRWVCGLLKENVADRPSSVVPALSETHIAVFCKSLFDASEVFGNEL